MNTLIQQLAEVFPASIGRNNEDGTSFKVNSSSEAGSRRYRLDRVG